MDSSLEWKLIPVENTLRDYYVSNDGQIYSDFSGKILNCSSLRGGYKSFHISLDTENGELKRKSFKVHQLVAKAFIPNDDPQNKNVVNHKDGNKLNNHVDNLEWVSLRENNQHAIDTGLIKITKRRVTQMDLDGNVIKIHETLRGSGTDTGVLSSSIAKCCKGTRQTAGGFKWKFTDENTNEIDSKNVDLSAFKEVNFNPKYLINDKGEVYSTSYKKFMKTQTTNDGYLGIQLANKGKRKSYLLHRLVAEHFYDNFKDSKLVRHKDNNKFNNMFQNLIIN